MAQILIIEADPISAEQLQVSLARKGYQVQCAHDYGLAHRLLATSELDLILAVERQGLNAVQQLVEATQRLPLRPAVIVLGEGHFDHAVAAFRSGAADYLKMPCAPTRLLAAVQAALVRRAHAERPIQVLHQIREQLAAMQALLDSLEATEHGAHYDGANRKRHPAAPQLIVGPLTLGRSRKQVLLNGNPLAVSPIEHRLLRCLAETPNEAVRFQQIVAQTHAYDATKSEAIGMLKSHLRNLRRKLPPGSLVTVRGVGVMLSVSGLTQPDGGPAAFELELGA